MGAGCDPTDPRARVDTGKQPWPRETSCKASGSTRGGRGSPGPAHLLSALPPGGRDTAKALSSPVSTCCLLLHPESLGGSPSPPRWGWGQPALMECRLHTAGHPPSPALILRLPMRTLRWLMGGGDASDHPSRDGTRAGVTLALCSLPGPADACSTPRRGPRAPESLPYIHPPSSLGLIRQRPRRLLRMQVLLPKVLPVTGEQTGLCPQGPLAERPARASKEQKS